VFTELFFRLDLSVEVSDFFLQSVHSALLLFGLFLLESHAHLLVLLFFLRYLAEQRVVFITEEGFISLLLILFFILLLIFCI